MPVLQANRDIAVSSPLGTNVLLFDRMEGSERLGRLPQFRFRLLSTNAAVKIADVLGKPMGVHLTLGDGSKRHFHGIVTRFASTGWNGEFSCYEATVHPGLWLLQRSSNCRIFQDKSVVDIVKEVCGDGIYGGAFNLDVASLSGTYDAMSYCVQYRETDFQFVCRLLEQAGIYFFFSYTDSAHTMVLADSYGAHATIPGYATIEFSGEEASKSYDHEGVFKWAAGGTIQSSNCVLNDFDFEKATQSTSGGLLAKSGIPAAFDQAEFEVYDYPGLYSVAGTGTALARARMESMHGQAEEIEAETNARGLFPGGLFTLQSHMRDDQNREYLVTGATYKVDGGGYASGAATPEFSCTFTAVGKEHSYRPPRTFVKPVVQGPQTAMVVGKSGEEIWTDKYGRIKVQFHWDRDGKDDENSSCWVRVQQAWAGKSWGAVFIPRIGMEVVVSFLEGDPDRPLVTGCVYNGDAMPPYALPDEQTKSTIKTNTSKGGGGFNEIRFEDKKDSEEIFVQAEKDFNRVVKNNDTLKVGFEKADKGDQTIQIKNDRTVEVGNNEAVKITKDRTLDVGGNDTTKVTGDQKVTVSKTIVIEATTSIELKVGSSSIKIEPGKITMKSAQIAVEADATAEIKAGATMTVKAGAPLSVKSDAIVTIEGALVKIN